MNNFLENKIDPKLGLSESEFLGLKKYREIEILLKKFPLNKKFLSEKELTKNECHNVLRNNIRMTEKDWDLLTILRLFDRATFEHSLGAFIIVRDKIENNSKSGIKIKKGIEDELGDIEIFYRACLFHDIGKISIPKLILKNSLNDKDWALRFYKSIKKQKNKICFTTKKYLKIHNIFHFTDKLAYAESPDEILKILKTKKIRPVQVVPLKHGISKGELRRLKKEYNISSDVTLSDVVRLHEKESFNVLYNLGYKKEAFIAGSHGDGGHKSDKNIFKTHSVTKTDSGMSDIIDLIYLADVQEALGSDRYYHKAFTKLKIMSILITDVESGIIDKSLACLWVGNELKNLKNNKDFQESIRQIGRSYKKLNKKEKDFYDDLALVENFLESICVTSK